MVSTRGPKFKFSVGERVLCYEPDPTKAKVLYDSKVNIGKPSDFILCWNKKPNIVPLVNIKRDRSWLLTVIEIVEEKDKKGKRTVEYLIHFQGWNSSWDRAVHEDFVLKDTDKNRQLQRDLAEKSQLQIGAYLYRKERKKRKASLSANTVEAKIPFRPSSDDGSSCSSTMPSTTVQEEIPEAIHNQLIDLHETESCSSSAESVIEEDRVALQISHNLKRFLEYDFQMITKQNKLVILPAKIPVVTILENFVKYYSIKSICGPIDGPRRRNSSAKNEKKEKDYDSLKSSINLRKEMCDGLRIYFDFILRDYLLYKQEREQYRCLLSPENLQNFTYIGSEKPSLDAILSFKQGAMNASDASDVHSVQLNESSCEKRRLRSHKNIEENEFILDLGAVAQQSNEPNCGTAQTSQMSSLSLLRQLLPTNIAVPLKTRELLQDILAWKLLPSDAPVEPSCIYGAVHLSRLIVKLPDFINATPMSDEKLKLLLQNLDNFIEFLETHREWFTEHQYTDAIKKEKI